MISAPSYLNRDVMKLRSCLGSSRGSLEKGSPQTEDMDFRNIIENEAAPGNTPMVWRFSPQQHLASELVNQIGSP
jgi:hypothetical protein